MLYINSIPVYQNINCFTLFITGLHLWDILFRDKTANLDNSHKIRIPFKTNESELKKKILNI